ncbi:MAG: GNAT family N-acetyltransferase [Planctomycetota bacterium]|mgnify:FL=1
MSPIHVARTPEEFERCYKVMRELRTHVSLDAFVAQVGRQIRTQAYELAYIEDGGEVIAVAGYRFVELLAWGKAMYVDDLVTASARRGTRWGSRLFDWLVEHAKRSGCDQLHLDSGVQRFDAHRFYLHKGMDITSHHFAMRLTT